MEIVETSYFDGTINSPLDISPFSAQIWVENELNPRIKNALLDYSAQAYDTPLLIGDTKIMLLDPDTISRYTGFLSTINNGWYPHYKGHMGSDGNYYDDYESVPDGVIRGRNYPSEGEMYRTIQIVNRILAIVGNRLEESGNIEGVESVQVVGSNVMTSYQPGQSDLDLILVLNDHCRDINKLMKDLHNKEFVEIVKDLSKSIGSRSVQIFFHLPQENGDWDLNGLLLC